MSTRALLMALLFGLLTGCAVTPKQRQSLDAYVQAMDQVRSGADELLTDYASAVKAAAAVPPAKPPPDYPDALKPQAESTVPTSEPARSIAASRRALSVIRSYNAALVALAEGRSEEDVKGQISSFGGNLESLGKLFGAAIPSFMPFAGIGASVIKLAQDAANRKQLESAVERGREPIAEMLKSMEAQAQAMYRFSVVRASKAQREQSDAIRLTVDGFANFLSRQGPPVDATVIGNAAKLKVELDEIGRRTDTQPKMDLLFRYGAGKPPLDAGGWSEAEVFAQAIRGSAQQNAEIVARQNTYHDVVYHYVGALRQAGESMNALSASLSGPVDLGEQTSQLFSAAFSLRDAIATYRNPGHLAPAPAAP